MFENHNNNVWYVNVKFIVHLNHMRFIPNYPYISCGYLSPDLLCNPDTH